MVMAAVLKTLSTRRHVWRSTSPLQRVGEASNCDANRVTFKGFFSVDKRPVLEGSNLEFDLSAADDKTAYRPQNSPEGVFLCRCSLQGPQQHPEGPFSPHGGGLSPEDHCMDGMEVC
jgi:hypothetical protein